MNNSAKLSLPLACLLTSLMIGCGPSLRPAPPLLITSREACLQQLGPPPPGVTLEASNGCPDQFATCLSKESAAALASHLAAWFAWIDQAWLLCGTSPSTSPAAASPPSSSGGAGASPSTGAPSAIDAGPTPDGGP